MLSKKRQFLRTEEAPSFSPCSITANFSTQKLHSSSTQKFPSQFGDQSDTIHEGTSQTWRETITVEHSEGKNVLLSVPKCSNSNEGSRRSDFLLKPPSMKTMSRKRSTLGQLFQRIRTEVAAVADSDTKTTNSKRTPQRRMCKVKTKQQFFDEYQSFLARKEKEGVEELFREVKREMKIHEQKNQGGMFYQNIRKEALNKIEYMYSNQKYFDHQEVKHLHSVLESCNVLIHKKQTKIDAKPLYNVPKPRTQETRRKKVCQSEKKIQSQGHNKFVRLVSSKSTHKYNYLSNYPQEDNFTQRKVHWSRRKEKTESDKSLWTDATERDETNSKLNEIMRECGREKQNLKGVKEGMKIFQFYCGKVTAGFQSKEHRLDRYLKFEEA